VLEEIKVGANAQEVANECLELLLTRGKNEGLHTKIYLQFEKVFKDKMPALLRGVELHQAYFAFA